MMKQEMAVELAENLVAPIRRQLGYLSNYRSNFDGLRERAEELGVARERLQRSVDEADRQGNEIFPDVQKWLLRAEEMLKKAQEFSEDEKRTNKRCFNGWCPDLKSRYQLSKEAKKLTAQVDKIQEANKFDRVSYHPPPPGTAPAPFQGSEAFKSRMPTSIASKVAEGLGAPIGGLLGYLFSYHIIIADLMEQVEKLDHAWWRLRLDVDEANRHGDEIFPDVQKWLLRAEEMLKKAQEFSEDEKRTDKRCFNGWCPDLKSRYQVIKEAKKLSAQVDKIQEANKFDRVSYHPPPPGTGPAPFQGSEAFKSRMPTSIASKVAEGLCAPIGGLLGYLFSYHFIIADLMEQVEKLDHAWWRLRLDVDEANRHGDEIFPDVQKWLLRAEEMLKKAQEFSEDEKRTNKRFFNGWCPDLKSRYQVIKEAKKLSAQVDKIQEANKFDRVSYHPPPPGTGPAPFQGSEAFKSRMPTSIASKVAEGLGAPIGGLLGYLFSYHIIIADLMEQVEKLDHAWWRLRLDVDEANRHGDEIFPDVQKWLLRAEEMLKKAQEFSEDEKRTNKRCFNGWCPDLKSRYQVIKEAKKLSAQVDKIQEANKFDRVSYHPPPPGTGPAPFQGFEALESRMWILNEIMDALRDAELNMIGIWGMGGVGKTVLAKQVASQAWEQKLFNIVVIAQVSLTPSLMQIQERIASMIGLQLEQENESLRANRLYERLKKEEKILIILDDIWAELDLRKVGIPWGDDHRGCKILLTSRDLFVLSNEMGTQRNFLVGHLSEKEAWRLFKKTAGDPIERPDLQSIAFEVAKEWAGLPIAIVSIAEALKHKDINIWKEALQQLRRSIMTNIEEFSDKLYSTVNLSYSHLNSDEIKSLFLLCGLIANDVGTDVLLKYVIGLALFEGVNTLEEATNRLQSLFHDLRAASLLLGCEDDKFVRMHDVVRDIAIEIATKEHHWLVREGIPSEEWSKTDEQEIATEDHHRLAREGIRLEEWLKTEEPEECTCISLNLRHIHVLPEWLECPKLEILRLSGKDPSLKIRGTFFEGMKELKVLDLSGMHFPSLPPSLCFLKHLRTLHLHECALGDIAMIGELKKLEVLSLVHSNIEQLPKETAQLTHLRLLDLRNCSQLKVIPSNVISKLSQLEKLCMENSFTQWEAEGFVDHKCNACVAELKFLSELIILDVKIPDASLLPKDELFENLIRYRIFIGDVWDWYGNYETSRTLRLNKFDTGLHLVDGISRLLKRTEDLCLRELSGTKNLLNLDREGFLELQYLHVQDSAEIQFIINSVEWFPAVSAFPVLKSLLLDNLIHLEGVCHGRLPVGSFCNLRFLTVENCSILSRVVPSNLLPGLQNLEVLDVRACNLLEEVFNFEGLDTHSGHVGMLPKLKELKLIDLPKLKHICNKGLPRIEEITQEGVEGAVEQFPELTSLWLESLPSLASFYPVSRTLNRLDSEDPHIPIPVLFDEKVAFPSLEFLRISGLDHVKKIWHNQLLENSFSKLKEMKVEYCKELRNVFPFHALQWLPSLQVLTTAYCDSLEEVFDLEGIDFLEDTTATHLSVLVLNHLPKMKHIFNKDPHGVLTFPNLDLVEVFGCRNLKNLFPASVVRDLLHFQKQLIRSRPIEEIAEENGVVPGYVFPEVTFDPVSNLQARKGKELVVNESDYVGRFQKKRLDGHYDIPVQGF